MSAQAAIPIDIAPNDRIHHYLQILAADHEESSEEQRQEAVCGLREMGILIEEVDIEAKRAW